jgi:predicted AlkP superfamily pyrophosphatase or phosphodiesterase
VNYKAADYVGHKHGPESAELRATLREMDTHLARMIAAIEAKVGKDYLLAITADHGMPGEPSAASRRHIAGSIVEKLAARFDPQDKKLVAYYEPENSQIFIDDERLRALRLTLRDLAAFLEAEPHIFAVFTEDELRRAVP